MAFMQTYTCEIGEDVIFAYAHSAEEAAEEAVARMERDRAEYPVAAGSEQVDVVVYDGANRESRFTVSGETVPSYHAKPLT